MIVYGVYDCATGESVVHEEGAKYLETDDLDIWVLNTSSHSLCGAIAEAYLNDVPVNADEMYLAFLYDRRKQEFVIFADITTSPLNLYYAPNNGKVYFSTSLKKLLLESAVEKKLDIQAAKAFLSNGYIVGESTLVEGVYKLSFGKKVVISKRSVEQVPCSLVARHMEKVVKDKEALIPTIQSSIKTAMCDVYEIAMPLSNGYDSNLILSTVLNNTDQRVKAFTVGGKAGISEAEAVADNVKDLNVELHTAIVDASYFEYFADIVWRLDGSVYESGVFLQYALAKMASEAGVSCLLCGEGSDEVQSKYYQESMNCTVEEKEPRDKKYYTYSHPFVGTHLMIMKKSAVMLNSFGIVGKYPFKSASVAAAAAAVTKENGTDKRYYKKLCRKLFSDKIASNLQTRGGTTGVRTVIAEEDLALLKQRVKGDPLFERIYGAQNVIVTDSYTKKLRREQGRKRVLSQIRQMGMIKAAKSILNNRRGSSLTKLFKEAYLLIFCELFISGQYDDMFLCDSAPVTTSELLFAKENFHEAI